MSANDENGEEIPSREIAYRLFAAEYDDASLSYAESDEERAPNYVITSTGARLNRVFAVGTLTEVTPVNDEMVRARVVDPTGAFVVYAGQYQPDQLAVLESLEPPAFVAVTGKARTFQPEDSDRVYTSIRPESIAVVDADTRDRWVVSAAEQTLDRIGTYAAAAALDTDGDALAATLHENGVESGLADGIPLAREHYGTTPSYLAALRECAVEAVEVVADERDQVSGLSIDPDESSPEFETTFEALADGVDAAIEAPVDAGSDDATSAPDPAEVTAGEDEPDPISTATADEFSAGEDVPAEPADEDSKVADGDTESAPEPEPDLDSAEATAGEGEPEPMSTATADEFSAGEDVPTERADEDADGEPASATLADTAGGSGADEPATDPEPDTAAEMGEFDLDDDPDETKADADDDLGDFDADEGGMYEMGDEEREQLESEFGTEFSTGSEVDDPGEAGIDVPEPDDAIDSDAESEPDADDLGEAPTSTLGDDSTDDAKPSADDADEPAEEVDLQAAVIETMTTLDDGDGANRSTLVERVADDTGADEGDVEAAIEEALMGGECYEPDDETLKAI
jgi:uncharacterized protein